MICLSTLPARSLQLYYLSISFVCPSRYCIFFLFFREALCYSERFLYQVWDKCESETKKSQNRDW